MKRLLKFSIVSGLWAAIAAFALLPDLAHAEAVKSVETSFDKTCLKSGDSARCFEIGTQFLKEKGKNSRKLARYYFRAGCSAQLKHSCSAAEAKAVTKLYLSSGRAVASEKQKPSVLSENKK